MKTAYRKNKEWREKNPDKLKAQSKRYREKHREECKIRCQSYHKLHRGEERLFSKKWYSENRQKKNAYNEEWKKLHPEKVKEYLHISQEKAKKELFELLGNKCANPNCLVPGGCREPRCLQVDHVHGNGVQQRKRRKHCSGYYRGILKEIKAGSEDYQLLCANCNWIKRVEEKEVRRWVLV